MSAPDETIRVLVVTGGHPFDEDSFFAMFDDDPTITWTHVAHPAARAVLRPGRLDEHDVVVLYDLPGITFTRGEPPVRFEAPSSEEIAAFETVLASGKGVVAMHHAIAGWPTWAGYAEILGGRFHYQPARLRGTEWPASGYRHDVHQTIEVLDPSHAICEGVPDTFDIVDEAYLFPVFEDDVVPLLRSGHRFESDGFFSADLAIRGRRNSNDGWEHPPGSDLVGWVKHHGNSPIAYLQFGDGRSAHRDPNIRRLLSNAIGWAASRQAHSWARNRARATSRSSG